MNGNSIAGSGSPKHLKTDRHTFDSEERAGAGKEEVRNEI
jgi:hypothetical protein